MTITDHIHHHWNNLKALPTGWALDYLTRKIKQDPEYAYTWYCNIAVTLLDLGIKPPIADRAAAKLMRRLFDAWSVDYMPEVTPNPPTPKKPRKKTTTKRKTP